MLHLLAEQFMALGRAFAVRALEIRHRNQNPVALITLPPVGLPPGSATLIPKGLTPSTDPDDKD
jgi:hypothetical protein